MVKRDAALSRVPQCSEDEDAMDGNRALHGFLMCSEPKIIKV